MFNLKERSLEWAIKHLRSYFDSDFYPKLFEFKAISHHWTKIKNFILEIDLDNYTPKSPVISLAPKLNQNFRVVHQLEPIDAIIYSALIYDIAEKVEEFRIPISEQISFSYRIKPDINGSLFVINNAWKEFKDRTKELASEYSEGYVIVADITDFYNQIYLHRVNNLIEEAGNGELDEHARVIEKFLSGLNRTTSRGIPVGPAASIVISELIMSDIDKKILNYTRDFVRYVDDIRIFFKTKTEAINVLHSLTKYLYTSHRLVFSSSKTKILKVNEFIEKYYIDEEKEEEKIKKSVATKLAEEELDNLIFEALESMPYDFPGTVIIPDVSEVVEMINKDEHFRVIKDAYREILTQLLATQNKNYPFIRHIIKRATKYRVRSILNLVLDNFDALMPVLRECIIYLKTVSNENVVKQNKDKYLNLWESKYVEIPFVNMWLSSLFQNDTFSELVNENISYDMIKNTRDKAMHAMQKDDTRWLRDYRDGVDLLGFWDKRAILFASSILPYDEMKHWVDSVASAGDIVDKAISNYLSDIYKPSKDS